MKIVCIDNFDRDWMPETVEAENLSPVDAKRRCTELNDAANPNGPDYYVTRADDAPVRTMESIT